MNIVVTGSVAFDYIMSFPGHFREHILVDKLDSISLSFLVDDMRRVYGGCAPNIAYSLALLGERPRLMASAGLDAGEYRDWLNDQGVDTSLLLICDDCFTASFFVNTDLDQNQIASFYTGAMARAHELSLYDITSSAQPPDKPDIVIIAPNDPQALADRIMELYKNPETKKRLGDNARRRIDTHFNINTTVEKTRQVFEALMAEEEK